MLATGLVAAQTAGTKCMSANHCCTVIQACMVARGRSGADNHIGFRKKALGELTHAVLEFLFSSSRWARSTTVGPLRFSMVFLCGSSLSSGSSKMTIWYIIQYSSRPHNARAPDTVGRLF